MSGRRRPRAEKPGRSAFAPGVGVSPSTPSTTQKTALPNASPKREKRHGSKAMVHFLSGGLSAGLVRFSLQPLDTMKTRLQATTRPTTLRATLLAGRGLRGLYRGAIPGVVGIVPAAAVYMLFFQSLKTRLTRRFPQQRNAAIAVAAGLGDVAACLVRVPCEVLKQRLQVGVYANVRTAMMQLGRPLALYAGLGAQLARDVPYAAVEFVVYENLKMATGKELGRGESFLVGGVAGAAAAVASNPLDVVKTRLMTQRGRIYGGVGDALVRVAREEGVRVFARGIAPRIAAKTLQSALFFAAYETIKGRIAGVLGVGGEGG